MLYFEKTAEALANVQGHYRFVHGEHPGFEVKPGMTGQVVEDVTYNPEIHDPEDIDQLSIWQEVLEEPQVPYTIPTHPLGVDLVVHISAKNDHPSINRAKQILGASVMGAVANTVDWADRLHTYIVGQPDSDIFDDGSVIIEEGSNEVETAKIVADLCVSGLAIVVSDFYHLPLESVDPIDSPARVGVQVSYLWFENQLLPESGPITVGGGREIDTDKKTRRLFGSKRRNKAEHERLERVDTLLSHTQQDLRSRAEAAGLTMAKVIFDPDAYDPQRSGLMPGYDEVAADEQLAAAIKHTTGQL